MDIPKVDWVKVTGGVCTSVLGLFILYGSYQFYFHKPIPIVNNTTVQPGANLNVKQGEEKPHRLFTSLGISTRKDIIATIGWLW